MPTEPAGFPDFPGATFYFNFLGMPSMNGLSFSSPPDGPTLLRAAGLLTLAAGLGVWGAILLAPVPQALPPMLQANAGARQDTEPVARWFGGGALRVRVAAIGLIS